MSFWDRKKAGQMVGAIGFYLDRVHESPKRDELCSLRQLAMETERSLSMGTGSVAELQRSLCSICRSEAIFHHAGDCCVERCRFLTIASSTQPVQQHVQFHETPHVSGSLQPMQNATHEETGCNEWNRPARLGAATVGPAH